MNARRDTAVRTRLSPRIGAISAALFLAQAPLLAQDAPPVGPIADAPTERPGSPASAENNAIDNEMTPALHAAVRKGLAALALQQNEDGSFGGGRYAKNIAVTALSCLSFLADGNTPSRGEYADNVRRGLEFVLANSAETGLLASDASNGPMYGHGFATLFLGEVYGMTAGGGDTDLAARTHETLVRAVRLIERTQNSEGGWRYNPVPYDADVSVTIAQIMAMRSARNAGLEVSKVVIDKAVQYVRQCQNADGGFRYQLVAGMSAWPRSAAGVASLYYAGIYEDDAIDKGLEYLLISAVPGGSDEAARMHYYYGHYYAVQSMYLAGGNAWSTWWPAIREEIITRQQTDGHWQDNSAGPAYGSAMALIILQMPKRYLPIFQK
ncbi:MAG: terpene cyclase/mutase family protein [Phycisphaerales bacterium]|nr:terpene cyclase/mutase family protein [Phycisphaerales bacterium]